MVEVITNVFQYEHSLPGRYYIAIPSIALDEKEFTPGQKVKVTIEPISDDDGNE